MATNSFIGRLDAERQLQAVLLGTQRSPGKVTVQSIEGPGGIGKTTFFDHVFTKTDLGSRNFLVLRTSGVDEAQHSPFRTLRLLVDSASGVHLPSKAPGQYFPSVTEVALEYEKFCQDAAKELEKKGSELPIDQLLALFDLTMALGKQVNVVAPASKKAIDAEALEKHRENISKALASLEILRKKPISALERLTLVGKSALRNAIKENPLVPLAEAFRRDLSAMLSGYEATEWFSASGKKLKGVDRLLLIVDDYEILKETLEGFLVGHVLTRLRSADFESTIILIGRDRLGDTSLEWERNHRGVQLPPISLKPFTQAEMDEMVTANGVTSSKEKKRAWADTAGYPYFVQMWLEETASGGRSAMMLKRVYERTTAWMNEEQKGWLHYALFLSDVNARTLGKALGNTAEAKSANAWFQNDASIRDTDGTTFRVREYLRSRLLDYLRISDPDRYDEVAERCAGISPVRPASTGSQFPQ